MTDLTDEEIRTIYRSVLWGIGKHGSFLVNFSVALLSADLDNFRILKEVALTLIVKYTLNRQEYLNVNS